MENAHLRLGLLEYQRMTEKTTTRIRVRVERYVGEDRQAHLLSVFGNDSDIGAVTAAVHEKATFNLTFPDGATKDISFGEHACRDSMLHRLDGAGLARWLDHVHIDREHIDHLPSNLGPGIMATLPRGCGRPLIDGNHRAARALRDGTEFLAYLLPEAETLELLRRSMGQAAADHYWNRLRDSRPHPNDVQKGE